MVGCGSIPVMRPWRRAVPNASLASASTPTSRQSGAIPRQRHADAADQPAPAHRHDDHVQARLVLDHLQCDRSAAGDDVGVRVRGDEAAAGRRGVVLRGALGGVVVAVRGLESRARRLDGVQLRARGVRRREHDARHAGRGRGFGQGPPVVAGGRGDERRPLTALGEAQGGVEGAADLEGVGALLALELEPDVGAGRARQPRRAHQRCAPDVRRDAAPGLEHGYDRHGRRHAVSPFRSAPLYRAHRLASC